MTGQKKVQRHRPRERIRDPQTRTDQNEEVPGGPVWNPGTPSPAHPSGRESERRPGRCEVVVAGVVGRPCGGDRGEAPARAIGRPIG